MNRRRWVMAGAAVVVATTGVVIAVARHNSTTSAEASRCARTQHVTAEMARSFEHGSTLVDILGDSYSVGATLARPRVQSWAALLARSMHYRVTVRGAGGTGFVNPGPCGNDTYAARVAQVLADRPSLVIVEGGFNDLAHPGDVGAAARATLARFPSSVRVVVVGPAAAPAQPRADEAAIDRTLHAVSTAAGRQYVSTLSWPLTYNIDRVHPDAAGSRVFATRLAAGLRSAG